MFDISQTTTALTPELTHSPASSVESSPLLSVPAYIPPPKMSTSPAQLALLEADAWFTSIDYLEPYQPPVQSYAYPQYDFPPSPPSSYYDYNYLLPPAKMYHSHPSVSTYAASAPIAHKSSSASSTSSGSSASSSGPGPVRRFQCPQCNRAFARHFNMKQHMETHNPMRVKPFLSLAVKGFLGSTIFSDIKHQFIKNMLKTALDVALIALLNRKFNINS
ncbi:hypothetical protein E3Q09_02188 [Wallemia mellicola]|uniref:C2H2-type domain-containing protein n=1 Tax=Wallemia mellicola TaxID=1708541 RepID=A0AB74KLE0_9BASI|nr:hypothetical protein E3Q11_01934 [Wallemia mellicola]TIC35486.1 hypothetical protein E3Q09_02188 [Wallemia mellicola]TIC69962.1 hypothetical protein E3Q03_01218 [Wallemia mellicola]